jgi:hypothetical protein
MTFEISYRCLALLGAMAAAIAVLSLAPVQEPATVQSLVRLVGSSIPVSAVAVGAFAAKGTGASDSTAEAKR